jgi:hypothetical protein
MIRTVSSPANVPETSFHFSESTAAASGCAPPEGSGGAFEPRNRRSERIFLSGLRERLVAFGGFYQTEFAQIARKSRLGDAKAEMDKLTTQLVLARDGLRREYFQDLALSESFVCRHLSVMQRYAVLCIPLHNHTRCISRVNRLHKNLEKDFHLAQRRFAGKNVWAIRATDIQSAPRDAFRRDCLGGFA